MKCPAFEAHGGRASSKKWIESLRVSSDDAASICGSKYMSDLQQSLLKMLVNASKPVSWNAYDASKPGCRKAFLPA